jgi:protein subunit release factor A
VTSQQRKRPNSEAQARADMTARLDALVSSDGQATVNHDRMSQIGCGARADKRRTYRFQEGVVADHMTGKSAPVKHVMKGAFNLLW